MNNVEEIIFAESVRYFGEGHKDSLINLANIHATHYKSFKFYNDMLYRFYGSIWNMVDADFPEVKEAKDILARSYARFIEALHDYVRRNFDLGSFGPGSRRATGGKLAFLFPYYRPKGSSITDTAAAYARALAVDHGYETFLVSTHCYPSLDHPPRLGRDVFFPEPAVDPGWHVLSPEGDVTRDVYVTASGPSLGPAKIAEMLNLLGGQRVDALVGMGGFDVIADLAALLWPAVCLETSRDEAVTFAHSILSLGEDVAYFHRNRADLYPVARGLFRLNPTLPLPPRKGLYRRSMFGLSPDNFVAVVIGYRINQEIDDDFVAMLVRTLEAAPRVRFVFAGIDSLGCLDRIPVGLRDRLIPLGVVPEVRELVAVCDCFVNTRRQGGGQGALVALAETKPVLTLPVGDVGSIMGAANCAPDMAVLGDRLCLIAADRSAYAAAAAAAMAIRRRYRFADNLPLMKAALDHARTVFDAARAT